MKGMSSVSIGFAADGQGSGVAYARFEDTQAPRVLRVAFRVKRYAGLRGREIGYAALQAVAEVLRRRKVGAVRFRVEDGALAGDLAEHREVPPALTLSYVRLRCALNQFQSYDVAHTPSESDLTARARSELALHVAA